LEKDIEQEEEFNATSEIQAAQSAAVAAINLSLNSTTEMSDTSTTMLLPEPLVSKAHQIQRKLQPLQPISNNGTNGLSNDRVDDPYTNTVDSGVGRSGKGSGPDFDLEAISQAEKDGPKTPKEVLSPPRIPAHT